ncbi:hypothetical protein PLICRDRAFT_32474 [Plicaturopsis crispa FD-325 SS-3]|uniref:Unplaced genomic scaffold PLICRscaffold_18, whole genome shotgun sequence n=1 Tax=Plicaturopsis crispa FD-325 SS-3 TaxID=944288 RepID=A0A0C9SR92_PLICR|nr:hypothetical protein PLICRDRAFT_32474 [Plicaturopsis crispa FD-325 SS-3]
MYSYTVEEAVALPDVLTNELYEYTDEYGPHMRTLYIQCCESKPVANKSTEYLTSSLDLWSSCKPTPPLFWNNIRPTPARVQLRLLGGDPHPHSHPRRDPQLSPPPHPALSPAQPPPPSKYSHINMFLAKHLFLSGSFGGH